MINTTKLDRLERSRAFLGLFQDVAGLCRLAVGALLMWWSFGTIFSILSNNKGFPVVAKGLLQDGLKTFFSVFSVMP
jgi:hypothetical protein